MADKCIGKLTLDISDVEKKVGSVNEFLSKIGAGVNIGDKLSKSIRQELNKLVEEAKKAGAEAQRALSQQRPDEEQAAITKLIALYKELYNAQANATRAKGNGDFLNVDFFNKKAEEASRNIDEIVKKWNEMKPGSGDSMSEAATNTKQVLQAIENLTIAENKLASSAINRGVKEAEANEKAAATAEKAAEKEAAAAAKAESRAQTLNEVDALKAVTEQLDRTIALYKQYYEYKAQAATAGASGNSANEQMYTQMAQSVQAELLAIQELNPWLTQTAEHTEEVAAAQAKWLSTSNAAYLKENAAATQEADNAVKEYATALTALYNEQAKLNNALATGKIKDGSAEYQAATDKIKNMEAAAASAGSKLDAEGIKMANSMQNVRKAVDDLLQSQAKMADSQSVPAVDRLQAAYTNLTAAIRNYRDAEKNKNEAGMQYWQNQISAANASIASIKNEVENLNVDEATRQRILNILQQCTDAQHAFASGTRDSVAASSELQNQISGLLTRYLSIMAVIRTVNNLIQSTTEYVSKYYDKMNEIRIITKGTEEEAERLGKTYRNLAQEMSVSSLDMADAAIYFTRQGLGAAEVEKRLKSTTQYAKAANIEFETAAELITAVVNSMGLVEQEAEDGRNAAERVADVFLMVGDSAATSGEEIGTAMQKAAAAAGAFGMEFEWLASYIATVSETTRQEATSIGTAFNTLIARLHSIRSTGYNSDDETKINDVQKALSKINVTLTDQDGEWRQITDIFNDVAEVWDTLDGKTKSYIATTMAGVKQQNVFLALMDDLSKKNENNSRAWELHQKALDSATTAQKKYAIYTDSVTAAQEQLTIAQEKFYSLLDANLIKDWYNALASIVSVITEGAEQTSGWSLILPVMAAGITGISVVIHAVNAGLMKTVSLATMLEAHPIMMAIGAAVLAGSTLAGVISLIASSIESTEEKLKRINGIIDETNGRINNAIALRPKVDEMFESLGGQNISTEQLEQYTGLLDDVAKISPVAAEAVQQLRDGVIGQEEAFEVINGEIDGYIERMTRVKAAASLEKYSLWGPEAEKNQVSKTAGWDESWAEGETDPNRRFANQLRMAYIMSDSGVSHFDERYLTEDIQKKIRTYLQNGVDWENIGLMIWSDIYGGLEAGEDNTLNQFGQEVFDDLKDTFSNGLSSVQQLAFDKQLKTMLFGEDGELSFEEYQNLGAKASEFIKNFLMDGKITFSDMDIAKALGESLFGTNMDSFFDKQGEGFAKSFVQGYEQALKLGLTDVDIKDLIVGTPVYELDDLTEALKERLRESVLSAFGMESFSESFEDLDTGEVFEALDIFDNLDIEALKLTKDLTDAGVTFEQIYEIASQTESIDDYKSKLRELGNTLGAELPEEAQEATKSMASYAKEIKNYATEIKSIDTILANIEKGKTLNMEDVFNLAAAHPEILQFIKDEKSLEEALTNLRNQIEQTSQESMKESILGDEGYFQSTDYYQNLDDEMKKTILTMNDYLEYIGEESAAYETINDDIDATVAALMGMKNGTDDTTKTLKEAADGVKEYSNEIKSIDTILDKISEGKTVSINDIFQLATSHPQLLQYTEDAKALEQALKNLRAEIETDAQKPVRDSIMNSTDFFRGTDYYAQLDDTKKMSITTMQKYLEYLGEEDAEYAKITATIDKLVQGLIDMQNAQDGKTFKEMTDEVKASTQEINKLDTMLKSLKDKRTVDFNDLLNLAAAHPEIVGTITDIDSLIQALNRLKGADIGSITTNLREMMLTNKEAMAQSPFAGAKWVDEGGTEHVAETMKDILDNAQYMEEGMIRALNNYLDQAVVTFLASSEQLGAVSKDVLGGWMENLFPESNVDLLNRKAVQLGDEIATVLSETITASADGHEGIKWNQDIICNFTPITPDGELLDDDTFHNYIDDLFNKSANLNELWDNDKVENGGKGLLISADVDFESFEEGIANAESLTELLHLLQEAYYGVTEANKTWLELQMEQAEQTAANEWAEANGYIEQLGQLQYQLDNFGGQAALSYFNSLDETMQKGLTSTYPGLLKRLAEMEKALKDDADGTKDLTKATSNLNKELQKSKDYASTKYFTDTAKAIKGLEEGTVSATSAYDTFYKECNKVTKAQEDITDVTAKMGKGTAVTVSDVSNLAGVLGMTAEEIISDFPNAVDIFNDLIGAGGDLEAMFNRLNEAAFIRITGVSEADFSNLENGLFAVRADAQEVIDLLLATGQWELDTVELPQEAKVWDPFKKVWTTKRAVGAATVLKPTGNNPFKSKARSGSGGGSSRRSSGGGGGGGRSRSSDSDDESSSSSTAKQMSEIERMLDLMSKIEDIQSAQRSWYQAQQKYYSQTGQLQGVIAYMKREKEALEEQNKTLEENVKRIEEQMTAKQAEVSAMDTASEGYADAADDLEKLQKAHQDYRKELIENKTAIVALNDSIKEQQRKIRRMEIDLENTILKAIEDREAKAKKMLSAEIEMENIILDLIKLRYEKERDQIIDTTNLKINSLREERDLLSEQLQLRKEQEEQEDKLKELNALEEKYAKISADPTRQKEALNIRKQINQLRKEMAWDVAEREVEAQQDAIDQQITSLEDYITYVEEYYEDLFEHPQKLIEEMRSIISKTDEEILAWLMANSEEFMNSTENNQKQMLSGWVDTLMDMRGELKLYWDEVHDIIAQGDEAIIAFLKANSAEYAAASQLQAEAFVDGWRDQLDALRKAHEDVAADIAASYQAVIAAANEAAEAARKASEEMASSGYGGGGGGGGGKTTNNDNTETTDHGYSFTSTSAGGGSYSRSDHGYSSKEAAQKAAEKDIDANMRSEINKLTGTPGTTVYDYEYNQIVERHRQMKNSIKAYASGGMVDYTGPAWVDGTPQMPERVLSPFQTQLFETMVQALEQMSRITIAGMPNLDGTRNASGNQIAVGDIIVNVDNLDTDDDYETMAERVSDILTERIGRTSVVGGLRINSI